MKKYLILLTVTLAVSLIQPLSARENHLNRLRYIPASTDVCLTVNLEALRKYMEKKGISRKEVMNLIDDGTSTGPLNRKVLEKFIWNLKRATIVFDSFELKKKKPKEFLILVEGDGSFPDFEKKLKKAQGRSHRGVKLYEAGKKDDTWFCRIENLYLLGNRKFIETYIDARVRKKRTISKSLMRELKKGKRSDVFLYFHTARLFESQLKKTLALGKGLGGSGLDENVFIRALYNLQYVTAEGALGERISFSLSMYGKSKEDAQRLTMVNHFLIVGVSFVFPFADKLSRSLAKKKLEVDNANLVRLQRIIGRIKTTELKKGTRISFSLTEKETGQFILAVKKEIKKSLIAKKSRTAKNQNLFEVIKKKDIESLKRALDAGASPAGKNKNGETLLYAAARSGNLKAVKIIVKKGASVKEVNDNDKKTPLHGAVLAESLEITAFLIEKGAVADSRDTFGHYPLHLAVKAENRGLVKLLIVAGADVTVKALDGETPLHTAAGKGNLALIDLLLKAGADKGAKDFYGDTPAARAVKEGHKEAAARLK